MKQKKQDEAIKVSDIINDIFAESQLDYKILEQRAIRAWPKIVGENVAKVTTRIFIDKGTLYLSINSSVIRNELIMLRSKIIDVVNQEAGRVIITAVRIR